MPSEPFITEEESTRLAEHERLKAEFAMRPVTNAFTYRDIGRDVDLLIEDLLRAEPHNPLGIPLYFPAQEFVVDRYYERGAFEPLARMHAGNDRWNGIFLDPFLKRLEDARRFDLIERVCTSVTRRARALFFYHRVERQHGGEYRVEQIKNEVLGVYDRAIDWMKRIGRNAAADTLREQRDALREERFPQLPLASDLRKMDESVFWELIRRAHSPIVQEHVALLGELLKNFRGPEIRRFASLYGRYMKQLYHWNVWALAYAARGGCSDDSFEEFRTWLILQGEPALLQLVVADPAEVAERVPRDPELPDGTLLPVIDEAYLARCGSTVAQPRIDLDKPKGKEWSEAAFDETFPDLVRHYAA